MSVGKPEVLTREVDGARHEPMEAARGGLPRGVHRRRHQKVGSRRGRMTKMVNHGTGRVRMEFRLPSRGLIGFRSEFLTDTKGTGIANHLFDGYEPWQGEIAHRSTGAMVADRPGRTTGYAIEHPATAAESCSSTRATRSTEGMVVGRERPRARTSTSTSPRRRSSPTWRASTLGRGRIHLVPPRIMSLEQSLEFLAEDELLEVTPTAVAPAQEDPSRGEAKVAGRAGSISLRQAAGRRGTGGRARAADRPPRTRGQGR